MKCRSFADKTFWVQRVLDHVAKHAACVILVTFRIYFIRGWLLNLVVTTSMMRLFKKKLFRVVSLKMFFESGFLFARIKEEFFCFLGKMERVFKECR